MVIFYDYTSSARMSEIDSTTGLLHGYIRYIVLIIILKEQVPYRWTAVKVD